MARFSPSEPWRYNADELQMMQEALAESEPESASFREDITEKMAQRRREIEELIPTLPDFTL